MLYRCLGRPASQSLACTLPLSLASSPFQTLELQKLRQQVLSEQQAREREQHTAAAHVQGLQRELQRWRAQALGRAAMEDALELCSEVTGGQASVEGRAGQGAGDSATAVASSFAGFPDLRPHLAADGGVAPATGPNDPCGPPAWRGTGAPGCGPVQLGLLASVPEEGGHPADCEGEVVYDEDLLSYISDTDYAELQARMEEVGHVIL